MNPLHSQLQCTPIPLCQLFKPLVSHAYLYLSSLPLLSFPHYLVGSVSFLRDASGKAATNRILHSRCTPSSFSVRPIPVARSLEALRADLQPVLDAGVRSLSVVLMHSFLYPGHEQEVGILAADMGFTHVSLSSSIMPMVKVVPRGCTALADAYLTPCIRRYLSGFVAGFRNNLAGVNVAFMQSDGGLTPMESFIGSRAIVSGPAGGVVGYAMTAYGPQGEEKSDATSRLAVIGFDMGGTSTDVGIFLPFCTALLTLPSRCPWVALLTTTTLQITGVTFRRHFRACFRMHHGRGDNSSSSTGYKYGDNALFADFQRPVPFCHCRC